MLRLSLIAYMERITTQNLTVEYKNKKEKVVAVDNLTLSFPEGKTTSLVGESGCGKTTLLRALAGLIPYSGKILFSGVEQNLIPFENRNLAFVQQEYALYPMKTVFDNIATPLKIMGMDKKEIIEKVYDIAEELNITPCLTRKPRYLSGGQQQRVALARALVKQPDFCLFDEPLSNVDPSQRAELRLFIKNKLKECQATAVFVTHDIGEALVMGDNLMVMKKGKIEICGEPMDVYNSGNPIVEELKQSSELKW